MRFTAFLSAVLLSVAPAAAAQREPPRGATLQSYGTDAAFAAHRETVVRRYQEWSRRNLQLSSLPLTRPSPSPYRPVPPGEPVAADPAAGVHGGGLVKVAGESLLVLHRDHLYSLRLLPQGLALADVAPLGAPPRGERYREILVSGSAVLALSERERGLGIDVLALDGEGRLERRGSYELWAVSHGPDPRLLGATLVDGKLVLYSPLAARYAPPTLAITLPRIRTAGGPSGDTTWTPLLGPAAIYRAPFEGPPGAPERVLHTLIVCDPLAPTLGCRASAVFGPSGSGHHLSTTALYVWTIAGGAGASGHDPGAGTLYRIPLDGSAPTAVGVEAGVPMDDQGWRERDGYLEVLLRGVRLLRAPLERFADGRRGLDPSAYRSFAAPARSKTTGRLVGEWAVWGDLPVSISGNYEPARQLHAAPIAGDGSVTTLPLRQDFAGFVPIRSGEVLVLARGLDSVDVHVARFGDTAALGAQVTLPRSEASLVVYQPQGAANGVAGVGHSGFWFDARAFFLRQDGLALRLLGAAAPGCAAPPAAEVPVECRVYSFVRPFWTAGRAFALLGPEAAELRVDQAGVTVLSRLPLAPRTATLAGRWEYTETIGWAGGPYHCDSRGTFEIEQDGTALRVRFRQTGECTVDGVRRSADGEGEGTGTVESENVTLHFEGCTAAGGLVAPDRLEGRLDCEEARDASGMRYAGAWAARRLP